MKNKNKQEIVIILVRVDDILIVSNDSTMLDNVKTKLPQKFKIKDLEEISRFLGIDFIVKSSEIKMNQCAYIKKILAKFYMTNCKSRTTASEHKLNFSKDDTRKYGEAIRSLIYLTTCISPDITWIVNKLARNNQNPSFEHWNEVKYELSYIKGTMVQELGKLWG